MKKASLIILVLSTSILGYGQYDSKAKSILDKVSNKYKNLKAYKADFKYRTFIPLADEDDTQEGSIIVSGQKFVLNIGGQKIINDGKTVWTYLKEEQEVNVMDYEPEEGEITPTNIYTMYENGYKYTLNEEMSTATEYVVDLTPDNKSNEIFKVRITVDKSNNSIKKWKLFEKNGSRYTYTITNFVENPKLGTKTFTWDKTKYADVEINDLR